LISIDAGVALIIRRVGPSTVADYCYSFLSACPPTSSYSQFFLSFGAGFQFPCRNAVFCQSFSLALHLPVTQQTKEMDEKLHLLKLKNFWYAPQRDSAAPEDNQVLGTLQK